MPVHIPPASVNESHVFYLSRRLSRSRKRVQVTVPTRSLSNHVLPKNEGLNENLNVSLHRSPFDALPVELQVEIFAQCLAPYPSFDASDAPFLLCRVCSSWRILVQATPKLWSSFGIDVPFFGPVGGMRNIRLMKTLDLWLERSRNNALSFRVCHNSTGSIPDAATTRVLAALIPHAHRWRDVHLLIPGVSVAPLQGSLPCLEGFPALRSLALDMRAFWDSDVPLDPRALRIPWSQITNLSLHLDYNHLLTLDHCLHILAEGENLVRCTLNADCTLDMRNRRLEKISLPSLKSLRLILQYGKRLHTNSQEVPESSLITFLEQLKFKELNTLALEWLIERDNDERYWSTDHPRFISILGNLAHSLQVLSFAYLPLEEAEILGCLLQLPNLTYLSLQFSLADREHDPVSDKLLRVLTFQPGHSDPQFLRLLQTIQVQCVGGRCTMSAVMELIQSRWESPISSQKLKAFSFISLKPVLNHVRQRMKTWTSAGLIITIEDTIIQ